MVPRDSTERSLTALYLYITNRDVINKEMKKPRRSDNWRGKKSGGLVMSNAHKTTANALHLYHVSVPLPDNAYMRKLTKSVSIYDHANKIKLRCPFMVSI